MFSKDLNSRLKNLDITSSAKPNVIRMSLEDLLDSRSKLVNTKHHSRYLVVQDAYSTFMDEYTNILDKRGADQ